jgi:hypothetical protein
VRLGWLHLLLILGKGFHGLAALLHVGAAFFHGCFLWLMRLAPALPLFARRPKRQAGGPALCAAMTALFEAQAPLFREAAALSAASVARKGARVSQKARALPQKAARAALCAGGVPLSGAWVAFFVGG